MTQNRLRLCALKLFPFKRLDDLHNSTAADGPRSGPADNYKTNKSFSSKPPESSAAALKQLRRRSFAVGAVGAHLLAHPPPSQMRMDSLSVPRAVGLRVVVVGGGVTKEERHTQETPPSAHATANTTCTSTAVDLCK